MAQLLPYNVHDLRQCKKGDVWRAELTAAANVFLVDSSGLSAFKAGRDFRYYGGGLIQRTPHDFVIPRAGHWYIVAHAWGLARSGRVSVAPLQVPQAMPPATPQHVDLDSIARSAAIYGGSEDAPPLAPERKEHDVFVAHAKAAPAPTLRRRATRSGSCARSTASSSRSTPRPRR